MMTQSSEPVLSSKRTHHGSFSPDARCVVAANDGRVWDLATGEQLARCEQPPHTAFVAWSPAGKVIALQSTTAAIRLCDAKTGKKLAQVKMACEGTSMAFSPDGKILFAGDWDGNLFAWSVPQGKLLHRRETGGMIRDVQATADQVGVTCGDDAIGLDPTLTTERWRASTNDLDSACLRLSGKERVLVGWDRKRLVKLALVKGKEVASAKLKVEKYAKSVAISPDGRHVCAVHGDEFILLDASLRERGRRRIEYANTATFSPDSRLLAISSWNNGEIWPVDSLLKSPA
jgi:WD40 repeat protein